VFPAQADTPQGAGDLNYDWSPEDNATLPYVFTFELPGVAMIDHFALHPTNDIPDSGATVALAVSTNGMDDSAFRNVGTVNLKQGASDPTVLQANVNARWVRMTIQASASNSIPQIINHLEAFGSLAPRPPNVPLDGYFVELDSPYPRGATQFDASIPSDTEGYVLTQAGASASAQMCDTRGYDEAPTLGAFDGRAYSVSTEPPRRWIANDEGTMFVGLERGSADYLVRSNSVPAKCLPARFGTGTHNIVVIDNVQPADLYPVISETTVSLPPYRFTRTQPSWLNASMLASTDTVVWNMLCNAGGIFDAGQIQEIVSWVSQGNKLIIHDSDQCPGTQHYPFFPYPFTTDNPGAHGAWGKLFIVLESDTLGSTDPTDRAHFVDANLYLAGPQQIGDANIVTTRDPHWCGHLFGSNVDSVNGFIQMYARYGRGLFIYDGLDHDDNSEPVFQRIVKLELDQPINGDLACSRPVAVSLVLIPDQTLKFVAGKDQTLHAALQLYANQVWSGDVAMTSSGELHADVRPRSVKLSGGGKPIQVAIHIPATTLPGTYPILVSASALGSQPAQATITVGATSSIASALVTQQRIRIYGIHFDYDSASIQPQSEPIIAQIAGVMQAKRALRFRVEGYTDSDGGFAYNMNLSQRRAQAVVNDLTVRYHVARARLVPRGYGMTDPVASNATDAGKALNRRVELVRI
jgi:outer membrane protein OmpA-like peptidoglycan-associated protein